MKLTVSGYSLGVNKKKLRILGSDSTQFEKAVSTDDEERVRMNEKLPRTKTNERYGGCFLVPYISLLARSDPSMTSKGKCRDRNIETARD
jgi:hypothetical protein